MKFLCCLDIISIIILDFTTFSKIIIIIIIIKVMLADIAGGKEAEGV